MDRVQRAEEIFMEGYNCAQAVFAAFADRYGIEKEQALRLAGAFGGGLGGTRGLCGAVSAMTQVCGLEVGAVTPDADAKKACYEVEQELIAAFEAVRGTTICREILGLMEGEQPPAASPRTPAYYATRPCVAVVKEAAAILQERFPD